MEIIATVSMDINNADDGLKVTILISALSERYTSLREIRKRVQETGIWCLGILLAVSAWMISATSPLTLAQRAVYIIGVLLGVAAIRHLYLDDLRTGFKSQQKTAAEIENTLGLFSPGVFDGNAIYPREWKHAGTPKGDGKFFETTYNLIYLGAVFAIFTILAKGNLF